MGTNAKQAPVLRQKGERQEIIRKNSQGRTTNALMIDNDIVCAIARTLGSQSKNDFAVMLLILGSARNGTFALPYDTVAQRLDISSSTYYKCLNSLSDKGLIEWRKGEDIIVDIDKLWRLAESDSEGQDFSQGQENSIRQELSEGQENNLKILSEGQENSEGQDFSQGQEKVQIPKVRTEFSEGQDKSFKNFPNVTQYNKIIKQDKKQDKVPVIPFSIAEQLIEVEGDLKVGSIIRAGTKLFKIVEG